MAIESRYQLGLLTTFGVAVRALVDILAWIALGTIELSSLLNCFDDFWVVSKLDASCERLGPELQMTCHWNCWELFGIWEAYKAVFVGLFLGKSPKTPWVELLLDSANYLELPI